MAIERRITVYEGPGGPFEGMAVADSATSGPRPGILVLPNIMGTKEGDFLKAEQLALLGYAAFVADFYGQGKRLTRADTDMMRYAGELNADRLLLRARLKAGLDSLQAMPEVDATRCGAIGFCFGGLCVLDMARGGLGVKGVVSFHGSYAGLPFPSEPISAKILICHGWDDPFCTPEATVGLATELTEAGADWQIHAYGRTAHAFTDEDVNMPENGLAYQADADRRSWKATEDFLAEALA
jgi:dienelactone hydrolase